MDESDRRRGKFIKDMTGVEWTDARNYHLTIDPSAVGAPRCPADGDRLCKNGPGV